MSLFLLDEALNTRLTYADVLDYLNNPSLQVYPCLRSSELASVMLNLIAGLVTGQAVVLLDADFSDTEVTQLLTSLKADTLLHLNKAVTPPAQLQLESAEQLAHSLLASNTAVTLFTSGTTGTPQPLVHRASALTRTVRTGPRYQDNVWALAYNPTHIAGVQVCLQALCNANPLINVFAYRDDEIARSFNKHGVTHVSATPTFYRLMLREGRVLNSVRRVTVGGEKSSPALYKQLAELFPAAKLNNIYASTEAGSLFVSKDDAFSVPKALEAKVKIKDGRLYLHASLLGEGKEKALDADWYDTGDLVETVTLDPLVFKFVARASALINVGGYNVDPSEVEAAVLSHPAVALARVYGVPNKLVGNLLACDLVFKPNRAASEKELRQYLRDLLQSHKVPRVMHVKDKLELTRTGKKRQ